MKNRLIRTALICLVVSFALAKEKLILLEEKPDHHFHNSPSKCKWCEDKEMKVTSSAPRVSAYDCSWCAFNDGVNRVCLDSNANLKAGWDIVQDWERAPLPGNTHYVWQLRLKPYITASAAMHPILLINPLYTNEISATIDQFTAYLFAELLYYDNYFFCFNAGWGTQSIAA